MHYDIGALSLWIGVGVALIVGAIQIAGWRHRVLIYGLIALGAISIVAAVGWPLIALVSPALASFMSAAATSPSSWVALILFVAALAIFSRNGAVPLGSPLTVVDVLETSHPVKLPPQLLVSQQAVASISRLINLSDAHNFILAQIEPHKELVKAFLESAKRGPHRGLGDIDSRIVRIEGHVNEAQQRALKTITDFSKTPNFDHNPYVACEGDSEITDEARRHIYRRNFDRYHNANRLIGEIAARLQTEINARKIEIYQFAQANTPET